MVDSISGSILFLGCDFGSGFFTVFFFFWTVVTGLDVGCVWILFL